MNLLSIAYFLCNLYWFLVELTWTSTIRHSTIWILVFFVLLMITPILILITYLMVVVKVGIIFLLATLKCLRFLNRIPRLILGMFWTSYMMLLWLKGFLSRR
ncbi:hypothetical protein [Alphacytorhabdovirus ribes]|nr:hypothetical protein [Black currant cytorhabdovirus 1]